MDILLNMINEALGWETNYASKNIRVRQPREMKAGKVFIVIKPGFESLAPNIIEMFEHEGFSLDCSRTKKLTEDEAKVLYKVHSKEDFFKNLVRYMASGTSIGLMFSYEDTNLTTTEAFKRTSKLKDEIRKKWGESDMRNVMHSSDKFSAMLQESQIYFS